MEVLRTPIKTAATKAAGAFEKRHMGAHSLRSLLSCKRLLLVNLSGAEFFNPLGKWLDAKNYFQKISAYDAFASQVDAGEYLEQHAPDFIFLHLEPKPRDAFEFARFAKSLCPHAKIVLFYPGSREEFESQFKNPNSYEVYDCLKPDNGYARLRGLLQRICA